jgi:hypothetical protein
MSSLSGSLPYEIKFTHDFTNIFNNTYIIILHFAKQEGHDGPEIAHLYIGPWANANFKPGTFI